MDPYEKIEGNKIIDLFNELYRHQVLIKVYVDGSDYEHLTVITDLEMDMVKIDPPRGLRSVLDEKQTTQLGFEFTGRDQLTHKFETRLQKTAEKEIWLQIPDHIRRYQFRNNFRIKAPRGAHLLVTIEKTDVRMVIDNISLGGIFCLCSNKHKPLVEANPDLTDLVLRFSFMDQNVEIQIYKATQKRLEPVSQPKRFGVAYEFTKVKSEAKRLLTQQIYELQREFLQRRFKPEDW